MKALFLIKFVILCFYSITWANETYLKFDEIQRSQKYPGYIDILDSLVSLKATSYNESKSSEFRTLNFRESIYHISKLRKAKLTLVFIHGLYGGAKQFDSFFQNMNSNGSEANAILLTLPGHYKEGNFNKPIIEATKEDWIDAVLQTLKIAKEISEKVVVIGQSTGGLLATYSAINYSNLVDGVILLEPALKVHTRIDIATCLGKHFVKEAASLSYIARLIGMSAPKGFSVSMGCEVAKFANELLNRQQIEQAPYGSSQNTITEEPLEESMLRLAKKIQTPVLMVNNMYDHVVDPKYNKIFAKMLNSKMYLEINSDGKTEHGDSETLKTNYKNNSFYQYTCDFLVQNFAEKNCAQIYYKEKMQPYIYPIDNTMNELEIKDSLSKINEDHVSEVFCKVFNNNYSDKNLCSRFKEMIQSHIQFWQLAWSSYKNNPEGSNNFMVFFKKWKEKFSEDQLNHIQKFNNSANYFKKLIDGVPYYDLKYIYSSYYEEYQKKLNFITDLQSEKLAFEKSGALLKEKYSNNNLSYQLTLELSAKIENVKYSDVNDALRLIEISHQLNEEILAQKEYLKKIRLYLDRMYIVKDQKVVNPDELEYIMKNFKNIENESHFKYSFNTQNVKIIMSYLLQLNSK